MKRIVLILLAFICIYSHGQVAVMGGGVPASSESYPAVLDDGNTEAWYIADEDNYTTVGDTAISQWDDMSGNSNHLAQHDTDEQPLYGGDSVYFNGVGGSNGSWLYDTIPGLEQPTIIYIVVKLHDWNASERVWEGTAYSSGTLFLYADEPEMSLRSSSILTHDGLSVGSYGILSCLYNGTSSSIQLNSGTATTGDAGTNDMGGFMIGGDYNGTGQTEMSVKEIIIRSVADNSTDKGDIISYLNNKYSIY